MNAPPYTSAELALLAKLWPVATRRAILAAFPTRTWSGLRKQAHKFKTPRPHYTDRSTRRDEWTQEDVALLQQHYPARGAEYVAGLVNRSVQAVLQHAATLQVRRLPPPPRAASNNAKHRPIGAKGLRPLVVGGSHSAGSPGTPIANAQKAATKAAREAKKLNPPVTADMIRALGANHPARVAWTQGVRAGAEAGAAAFHQAMNQLKQAA